MTSFPVNSAKKTFPKLGFPLAFLGKLFNTKLEAIGLK
jgi:hypothetical protein